MKISDARALIDALDRDIVTLLARRLEIVEHLADAKEDADLPVIDVERAREVVAQAKAFARRVETSPVIVERVFGVLVAETGAWQVRRRRD